MSAQRVLLGGGPQPRLDIPIPHECEKARTIYMPITKDRLFLRKHEIGVARQYIYDVLPSLLVKNWTPEKATKWFYDLPEYSWLEFEVHTKLLYLCSYKK